MIAISIIISLAAGIAGGRLLSSNMSGLFLDKSVVIVLCLLVAIVGFLMGAERKLLNELKRMGFFVLIIPVLTIAGSLAGGLAAAALTSTGVRDGIGIASGLGWYSLSGVLISSFADPVTGSTAFLSNIVREFLTFIIVPVFAKWTGGYFTIGLAGATAMDSTLPVIAKYGSSRIAAAAFLSGAILSLTVPVLVTLSYTL